MAYQLIEDYTLEFTGGTLVPKGWAIHWWGDPNQRPTFWGILNVLQTRSAQKSASVNFMAEANLVACLVDPFTVAWGQGDGGNGWGNLNLVSVECNPRCTPEDRETVAELIADQNILNGIPIVLHPHKNFTATACPGVWEQWIPWITARAHEIVAEKTNGEDVMSAQEVKQIIDFVQLAHDVTRKHVIKEVNQFTQDASDVTRTYLSDRVREADDADEIVNIIPTEIAQLVIDGLSKRLAE